MSNFFIEYQKLAGQSSGLFLKNVEDIYKGSKALVDDSIEYTKSVYKDAGKAFEEVVSAGSIEKALKVSTDYGCKSYEKNLNQWGKYVELVSDSVSSGFNFSNDSSSNDSSSKSSKNSKVAK